VGCTIASSPATGANHLKRFFAMLTWVATGANSLEHFFAVLTLVENGVEHKDAVKIIP
jgi:hypothetical protein